jgi:mannosyltransferase
VTVRSASGPAAGLPRLRDRPVVRDRELAAVVLLTGFAAAIRFATLGTQSLWFDEAVTVLRVLKPGLLATLDSVVDGESTPPLYYVLTWAWTHVFGSGAVGVRSLSAVVGTLTVPVAWQAARTLGGPRAGLVLAALVAVNPLDVWYSQEARAYALLILLTALSFLFFVRALEEPRARWLGGWALACALALATHYFAAFLVAPEALWLLARRDRRRAAVPAVAAVAAVAAALAPLALAQHDPIRIAWITHLSLGSRMTATFASPFAGGSDAPLLRVGAVGALIVACGVAAVLPRLSRRDLRAATRGLVVGLAALAVPAAIALAGTDLLVPRNLVAVWLPLGAGVAVLLGAPRAGRRGLVAAFAICALSLGVVAAVDVRPRLQRADWRDAAGVLGPADRPRAIVAPFLGLVPLQLYLRGTRRQAAPAVARVEELDLVGWAGGRHRPLRPPPGFRLAGRLRAGDLLIVRLRTRRPRALAVPALLARRLSEGHTVVLVARRAPTRGRTPLARRAG